MDERSPLMIRFDEILDGNAVAYYNTAWISPNQKGKHLSKEIAESLKDITKIMTHENADNDFGWRRDRDDGSYTLSNYGYRIEVRESTLRRSNYLSVELSYSDEARDMDIEYRRKVHKAFRVFESKRRQECKKVNQLQSRM